MAESNSSSSASGTPAHRYTPEFAGEIELKWQAWWDEHDTFRQPNPGENGFDSERRKFYCLDMFPYPSGAGLHVGHPEGYTATDILCRMKMMQGFNVLHPMGWDAFGLPAEQYAIQTGVHPAVTTTRAIDNFRRQLKRFGFGYDWSREFATIDPEYYKWTQWIWLQAYNSWFDESVNNREGTRGAARPISELREKLADERVLIGPGGELVYAGLERSTEAVGGHRVGTRSWSELNHDERDSVIENARLAYLGEQTVNWCPKLGTALANEEVIDGRSERGGFPVYRKPLRQWMFRITAFADRLLKGLEGLDWPSSTVTMQREWIGRSEGAEIDFELDVPRPMIEALSGDGAPGSLRVYTTRPDTLFGATYMVVAPEHPLVALALSSPRPETDVEQLRAYVRDASNRSDVDRQEARQKTGVFTGVYATNPANGEKIPVWTADYVLMGYGTGAIMAVPAHDQRDFEFAQQFGLDIRDVVYPPPLFPLWWLGNHATREQIESVYPADEDGWRIVLADFLGYVTGNNTPISEFPTVMKLILTRRSTPSAGPAAAHEGRAIRGAVVESWLDTIRDMRYSSIENYLERARQPRRSVRVGEADSDHGVNVASANNEVSLNGLRTPEAKQRIIAWLEKTGIGRGKVNYKLRDWLFSRQRYWGEPFPIVFDREGRHYPVRDDALPVVLPEMADYQPIESDDPTPLLGKATDWLHTTAGEAGVDETLLDPDTPVTREANTMPGWAGSCWYYLRYCSPRTDARLAQKDAEQYWMGEHGVDLYVGGAEHAVLHLLYARFWHKILFDLGHVESPEPFRRLFHQGLILSHAYQRADRSLVPIDEVEERGEEFIESATGNKVTPIVAKMSKSLRNVVNPDEIIHEFGADSFRLYEMYMGPLDASKPWATKDIVGLQRFLQRAWRLAVNEETGELAVVDQPSEAVEKQLHRTIAKVGEDVERLAFNTAIAAMIEFVNTASKEGGVTADQLDRFARTLAPFAPHVAEEMWARLAKPAPVSRAPWPSFDPAKLSDDTVEIPVQVLGKLRSKITVSADADAKTMEAAALADEKIQQFIEGKTVRKVIVVPGRLVNIVAN
jgi:leucyl-tRNA synthetase